MSTFLTHVVLAALLAAQLTERWKVIRFVMNAIVAAFLFLSFWLQFFDPFYYLTGHVPWWTLSAFINLFFQLHFVIDSDIVANPFDPYFINKGQTTPQCTRILYTLNSRNRSLCVMFACCINLSLTSIFFVNSFPEIFNSFFFSCNYYMGCL